MTKLMEIVFFKQFYGQNEAQKENGIGEMDFHLANISHQKMPFLILY